MINTDRGEVVSQSTDDLLAMELPGGRRNSKISEEVSCVT